MDQQHAREVAASLREFADFVESSAEDLGVDFYVPTFTAFVYDHQEWNPETGEYDVKETATDRFKNATKVLKRGAGFGNVKKNWDHGYLEVTRTFGEHLVFEMNIPRDKVCKRVVVGTEEIEERVIPASTREITEWVCDDPAILNL